MKTKVHTTRNAAAQLDEEIERTVFLEVQIQNTSPEALHFDQLAFNPAEHQEVEDITELPNKQLQPGDLLQCLYIIKSQISHHNEMLEKAKLSGGVMPLGKLDIRWRTRMGDPGHLSTSQLVRRLPLHMLAPSLPQRPSMQHINTGLNPYQTPDKGGAARNREHSPMHSPQLGTPGAFSPAVSPRLQHLDTPRPTMQFKDLTAKLTVLPFETRSVQVQKVITVKFKLSLTSMMRNALEGSPTVRKLKIAVQHVEHGKQSPLLQVAPQVNATSRMSMDSHAFTDATPLQSARTSIDTDKPLPIVSAVSLDTANIAVQEVPLPPPAPLPQDHPFYYPVTTPIRSLALPDPSGSYYGNTLLRLAEIIINHQAESRPSSSSLETRTPGSSAGPEVRISLDSASTTDDLPLDEMMRAKSAKRMETVDTEFQLQYVASASGIVKLGGVRILLLEDQWCDGESQEALVGGLPPCTLIEHNVVAEVMVGM